MQTGYGADSVRSRDLRINCLHPREWSLEIHAIIRLTTSFGGVLGTMAGVEQYTPKSFFVIFVIFVK